MRDRSFRDLSLQIAPVRENFVMPGRNTYRQKSKPNAQPTVCPDAARANRIAELKRQVQSGTYQPNMKKVAERLLPELLEEQR